VTEEEAWAAALERYAPQFASLPGAQGSGIDPAVGGLVVYVSGPEFTRHVPRSVHVEDEVGNLVEVPVTARAIGRLAPE
jgi:hypothetical protein